MQYACTFNLVCKDVYGYWYALCTCTCLYNACLVSPAVQSSDGCIVLVHITVRIYNILVVLIIIAYDNTCNM